MEEPIFSANNLRDGPLHYGEKEERPGSKKGVTETCPPDLSTNRAVGGGEIVKRNCPRITIAHFPCSYKNVILWKLFQIATFFMWTFFGGIFPEMWKYWPASLKNRARRWDHWPLPKSGLVRSRPRTFPGAALTKPCYDVFICLHLPCLSTVISSAVTFSDLIAPLANLFSSKPLSPKFSVSWNNGK